VTRRRARVIGVLRVWAAVTMLGGCVYYPTVMDVGGTRVLPSKGRAVRDGAILVFYCELQSVGKYGDTITGVTSPIARQAQIVDGAGAPLVKFEIPGETTIQFVPDGTRVVLSDLTRPVSPGETIIVTLLLQKAGGLGIVTVVE